MSVTIFAAMEENGFYDHSTYYGRFHRFLRRITWPHVLASLCLTFGLLFWVALLSDARDSSEPLVLQAGPAGEKSLTYAYDGLSNGKSSIFGAFPANINIKKLNRLEIRNAIIDGDKFTKALNGAINLQYIHIDAAGVIGHYNRVYLPSLTTFEFNWLPTINADEFKNVTTLKELLFFDKLRDQNWDFQRDALNLPLNISVMVDGTMILEVNRATGFLNVNLHFGSDILPHAEWEYSRLTLSWCPLENVSMLSPAVKYINLNNALPKPGQLPVLIRSLKKLEEFHVFQPMLGYDDQAPLYYYTPADPWFQTPVNLSDFAPTLTTLSVGRLGLVAPEDFISNIADLSLEDANVSSVIIDNFVSMFPKVKTVRLFNVSGMPIQGSDVRLLSNVLKTRVSKIVVTDYKWDTTSTVGKGVTQYLTTRGLPIGESNFLVLRNSTEGGELATEAIARPLTFLERNYKRYESMGFKDIDTYEDYLLYDSVGNTLASSSAVAIKYNVIVTITICMFLLVQQQF